MRLIFRVVLLSVLACVLAAMALGWLAVEVVVSAWPDVSVDLDGEVFRWSDPGTDGLGWWVVGLTLALVCMVVMVPLILLFGVALPVLLALGLVALGLALPLLAVALALAPLWLLLWLLWRVLRPAPRQVLTAPARG